jgi:hypothetical protein
MVRRVMIAGAGALLLVGAAVASDGPSAKAAIRTDPRPTLIVGRLTSEQVRHLAATLWNRTESATVKTLGRPQHVREEANGSVRWIYTDRDNHSLVVRFKDGHVTKLYLDERQTGVSDAEAVGLLGVSGF